MSNNKKIVKKTPSKKEDKENKEQQEIKESIPLSPEDLIPKAPERTAPRGIRVFTICRRNDETGVSGTGVIIEGVTLATGQCIVHWLLPTPRGSIAIFDSLEDFVKIHITPHEENETILTYENGETIEF